MVESIEFLPRRQRRLSDQSHFDSLGFVQPVQMWGHAKLDNLFAQLRLKLDRLREVEQRARERK
jgi:hypothetical protein